MLTPKEKGGGGGVNPFPYAIDYSCLFDGTSDYLSRTPASAGDRTEWTLSLWVKSVETSQATFFSAGTTSADCSYGTFIGGDDLAYYNFISSASNKKRSADSNYEPTGWQHIVIAYDSDNATQENRVRLYRNGVEVTNMTDACDIVLGEQSYINSTQLHKICADQLGNANALCIADMHFVDGSVLTPTTWGEQSGLVTGLWVPKNPGSLTYGTNGCYLDFSNAADLGEDSSGNGNNWTVNGLPKQTLDTPTNNYATWNPLLYNTFFTYSNGNLTCDASSGTTRYDVAAVSIAPKSGKFYIEYEFTSDYPTNFQGRFGAHEADTINQHQGVSQVNYDPHIFADTDRIIVDGVVTQSGLTAFTPGDTIGMAFDCDAGTVQFYDDGGSAWGSAETNTAIGNWLACTQLHASTSARGAGGTLNNGAQGFKNTPPSGYLPLCTANLTDPTIIRSSTVADLVTRVGTGAEVDITGLDFSPDAINIKNRDISSDWLLMDTERGADKQLSTNNSDAETSYPGVLESFNSDGYTIGTGAWANGSGNNILDLCLKAGVDQGFEMVTYTGNGVAGRTVSHNLGKAPTFMIVKRLDGSGNWWVYHTAIGGTGALQFTTAVTDSRSIFWNDTDPTSTDIVLGSGSGVNGVGLEYIAYLFTDSDIFKAFSYKGNGSSDTPFVNLGGKPRAVPFLKNSDDTTSWFAVDSARNPFNSVDTRLFPNLSDTENSNQKVFNFTSVGLKVDSSAGVGTNGSGNLIVGLAILETNKYSNAY